MANYYVRSSAAGAGTGADWANAYTTLTAALAGRTSADVLWVADDHAESTVGAVTLTLPTSPGLKILGVNTHVTEPPTGLVATGSPSAVVAVGASSNAISIAGMGYIYGIIYQSGTNASASCIINIGVATTAQSLYIENSKFDMRGNHAGADTSIGSSASGSVTTSLLILKDCVFKFGATTHNINIGGGIKIFKNMSFDSSGSTPTTVFYGTSAATGSLLIEDSDLSGEAFTNLFDMTSTSPMKYKFRNCKLPGSITVATGTLSNPGSPRLYMHNCDSADTNYRLAEHSWAGSVTQQTSTLVRTGGATDAGGTPYSLKMAGTANAEAQFALALESPEISAYNTAIGSALTATVEILTDSATNLQDDEVWLEISYLGTSGFPLGSLGTDRVADAITAAADQTASSVTWDTTGMTNPNKQKLVVSFTPQEKGYVIGRVMLAKNITTYVDPYITIA